MKKRSVWLLFSLKEGLCGLLGEVCCNNLAVSKFSAVPTTLTVQEVKFKSGHLAETLLTNKCGHLKLLTIVLTVVEIHNLAGGYL